MNEAMRRKVLGALGVLVVVALGLSLFGGDAPESGTEGAAATYVEADADGADGAEAAPRRPDAIRLVRAALQVLTPHQEVFFNDHMVYTDDIEALTGYGYPEGVEVEILEASAQGWSAVARPVDDAEGRSCVVSIGSVGSLPSTDRDRLQPQGFGPGQKVIVCDGDALKEGAGSDPATGPEEAVEPGARMPTRW